MTIGERIRSRRAQLGISQVALADKAKVSKQTLYKYETNVITNIPSNKIEELAIALRTTPAFLMGWEDPAPAAAPLQLTPLEEKIITRYRISPATIQGAVCDILHVSQEDADNAQYSESNNANAG